MPTDFHCSNCSLDFSLGSFHYHRFESGYGGARLMVCKKCGTPHTLECALHNRGPEFYINYQVVVEALPADMPKEHLMKLVIWLRRERKLTLSAALGLIRNPPFIVLSSCGSSDLLDAIRFDGEQMGLELSFSEISREPNLVFGPILKHRLHSSNGPNSGEKPTERKNTVEIDEYSNDQALQCLNCGETGVLVSEIETTDPCPSCKQTALRIESSWIT